MFGGFTWIISNPKWWMLLIPVIFVFWTWLESWIGKHAKGKVMKVIHNFVSAPLVIVYIAVYSMTPIITIVGTIIFVVLFSFCTIALILIGLNYFFNLELQPETISFITITLASIVCSNSYRMTKKIVSCSPLRNRGEHRYEIYMEKLAYYLIHPSNIVFVLYLIYFVLLTIIGFMQIQHGSSLISEGYDEAILKAFLVFIAFTNMKSKAQDSDLEIHELLKLAIGLFKRDDENWLRQRFNCPNDS